MKRFWDKSEVIRDGGGFAVRLDGRPMRLPGGPALLLPSLPLAEAIAAEWQQAGGQKGGDFQAEDVPLTRIAGTAQERVAQNPAAIIDAIAAYGESDLLCYGAATPPELARRQQALWTPWLDWAAQTLGAHLSRTTGVMPVAQPPEALLALRTALASHNAFILAGLGVLVPATGSLVLGLAVAGNALTAAEAHQLAALDELFEEEQWGEDREATLRRRNVAADIEAAGRFIALSASPGSNQ